MTSPDAKCEMTVLLFNADSSQEAAVKSLAPLVGARVRLVGKGDYSRSIEELVRGEGSASRPCAAKDFSEAMMVMAGFPREIMFMFLDGLKRAGATGIRLKAVLTPTNAGWTPGALRDELISEEEAMRLARQKT